jgi:hypothetical protein
MMIIRMERAVVVVVVAVMVVVVVVVGVVIVILSDMLLQDHVEKILCIIHEKRS